MAVDGNISCSGTIGDSDKRLKKDIAKIENPLELVKKIDGQSFYWDLKVKHWNKTDTLIFDNDSTMVSDSIAIDSVKNKKEKLIKKSKVAQDENMQKMQYGVIAQDVQKILPEIVYENEDGYLGVKYDAFIPILIEAVKEQQTIIEEIQQTSDKEVKDLQKENKKLKRENEQINERLTLLENQLDLCCKENNSNSGNNGGKKEKTGIDDLEVAILYQNTPNPFTESTKIDYYLPETVNTAIIYVYDLQGIQKASFPLNERGNAGLQISGSSLVAGMYIYSLIADGKEIDTKRMILTK